MKQWLRILAKAKNRLSKHDPRGALGYLQEALEDCPPTSRRDTVAILFYTGVALQKLGYASGAIKSWNIAVKLDKDGYSSQMLERLTNDYGMERCSSAKEDDRRAFRSLQLKRYREARNNGGLIAKAESDMIESLIEEAWRDLRASGRLEGLCAASKMQIFKETLIIFPFVECPKDFTCYNNVIPHDFAKAKEVKLSDRCLCGSGRTYMVCCGRISPSDNMENEVF